MQSVAPGARTSRLPFRRPPGRKVNAVRHGWTTGEVTAALAIHLFGRRALLITRQVGRKVSPCCTQKPVKQATPCECLTWLKNLSPSIGACVHTSIRFRSAASNPSLRPFRSIWGLNLGPPSGLHDQQEFMKQQCSSGWHARGRRPHDALDVTRQLSRQQVGIARAPPPAMAFPPARAAGRPLPVTLPDPALGSKTRQATQAAPRRAWLWQGAARMRALGVRGAPRPSPLWANRRPRAWVGLSSAPHPWRYPTSHAREQKVAVVTLRSSKTQCSRRRLHPLVSVGAVPRGRRGAPKCSAGARAAPPPGRGARARGAREGRPGSFAGCTRSACAVKTRLVGLQPLRFTGGSASPRGWFRCSQVGDKTSQACVGPR